MIIPVNVPETAKAVSIRIEYVGSMGTDLIRVIRLEEEELKAYREEPEK